MENLEKSLKEHAFLKTLNNNLIIPLIACASEVSYEEGEMIYREEDDADHFHLIIQGMVAIEIFVPGRGPLTIQTVGPNDVLGWSWLFPPYTRRFDARAVEFTKAIALDGTCLRERIESDYQFGYEVLKRFSRVVVERLRATSLKLLDIYGKDE